MFFIILKHLWVMDHILHVYSCKLVNCLNDSIFWVFSYLLLAIFWIFLEKFFQVHILLPYSLIYYKLIFIRIQWYCIKLLNLNIFDNTKIKCFLYRLIIYIRLGLINNYLNMLLIYNLVGIENTLIWYLI